jgi:hypothetical protein
VDERKANRDTKVTDERERSRSGKRAWQSPRIKSGQLFESNSLSCGKNTPGIDQCNQNPTQS